MTPIAWRSAAVLALLLAVAAPTRAALERIIGPEIASGPDYTVHSPQAVTRAGLWRCGATDAAPMPDAAYRQRFAALQAKVRAWYGILQTDRAELARRHGLGQLSDDEFRAGTQALAEREDAFAGKALAESERLHEARKAPGNAAFLALHLLHAPRDPNAPIIPRDGALPSSAFIAGLNRILELFLVTCGDRLVSVAHYYRNPLPPAKSQGGIPSDAAVARYNFRLRGGALTLELDMPMAANGALNGPRPPGKQAQPVPERILETEDRDVRCRTSEIVPVKVCYDGTFWVEKAVDRAGFDALLASPAGFLGLGAETRVRTPESMRKTILDNAAAQATGGRGGVQIVAERDVTLDGHPWRYLEYSINILGVVFRHGHYYTSVHGAGSARLVISSTDAAYEAYRPEIEDIADGVRMIRGEVPEKARPESAERDMPMQIDLANDAVPEEWGPPPSDAKPHPAEPTGDWK